MTTAPPTVDLVPGVSLVGTTRGLGTDVDALLTRFGILGADRDDADDRPQIELVVIDDGATPGAFAALRAAGTRTDRVRSLQLNPVRDRRDHLYEAGLRTARGEFVLLLDGSEELDATAVHRAYDEAVRQSLDVVLLTADDQARRVTDPAALRGRALIRRSVLADPPVVVPPLPADLDLRQVTLEAVGRSAAIGTLAVFDRPVAVDAGLSELAGQGPLLWRPVTLAARAVLDRHAAGPDAARDVAFVAGLLGLDADAHELVAVQLDAYAPGPVAPPPPPAEDPEDQRARFADRLTLAVDHATHHWSEGQLVVQVSAHLQLDGVALRPDDDGLDARLTADLATAATAARPAVALRRRGTTLSWAAPGSGQAHWDGDGWRVTAAGQVDPARGAGPVLPEAVLDLFVEVAVLDRTLAVAVTHQGTPAQLPALLDGTPVIAYRTRAGLLAVDVGAQLHDVIALALRGQVGLTSAEGRTALAVSGLHAVGRTELDGTMAFGDRKLPVQLVHDSAGTRVVLEAGSRVALARPGRNAAADLDAIGRRRGLDQASDHHDYLRDYQVEIDARPVRSVVIISGRVPDAMAQAFAEYLPDATIHLLSVKAGATVAVSDRVRHRSCPTVAEVAAYLLEVPPPDVIIEDGTNKSSHKAACFRAAFLHLADGGVYISEDLHAHWMPQFSDAEEGVAQYVDRLLTLKSSPRSVLAAASPDDLARARGIHRVSHYGKFLVAERQGEHLVKVRDEDTERVLSARRGPGWGEVLFTRDPLSTRPRCTLDVSESATAPDRFHPQIEIPALSARRYRDVVCAPRQLVLAGDVVPSIAFHHPLRMRLVSQALTDLTSDVAALKAPLDRPEPLPGIYYHLDSEYPGHFGHFMTEDVGRLWGWHEAKQRFPDLRLLVSTTTAGGDLPGFQRTLLNAHGIVDDDIICIDRPVQVQELVGVSPMFHNGRYVHPELATVWASLRLRLVPDRAEPHRRIFVGRPPELGRNCHNADEVEAIFTAAGFEVVYPERLAFTDQVRLFAESRAVAGWAGSGLFGSIFAPRDVTRIVLASEAYDATNEWVIAGAQGGAYHHFWCTPDLTQPPTGWSRQAFQSDFTFDVGVNGDTLRRVLSRS